MEPVLARHLRLKLVPNFALCFQMLRDVVNLLGWSSERIRHRSFRYAIGSGTPHDAAVRRGLRPDQGRGLVAVASNVTAVPGRAEP